MVTTTTSPSSFPLIDALDQMNFRFDRVFADAGYYSPENYKAAHSKGAEVFIDFPVDAQPCGFPHHDEQLAHCNANGRDGDERWNAGYRWRPLVESANSMLKRVIKRIVRARTEEARETELLLALLAHNLCQLAMARAEYGMDIPFADQRALAIIDAVIKQPTRAKAAYPRRPGRPSGPFFVPHVWHRGGIRWRD
ncbi:MAG: transposase [Burkholderiales bacterium]